MTPARLVPLALLLLCLAPPAGASAAPAAGAAWAHDASPTLMALHARFVAHGDPLTGETVVRADCAGVLQVSDVLSCEVRVRGTTLVSSSMGPHVAPRHSEVVTTRAAPHDVSVCVEHLPTGLRACATPGP